jgi:hypothetical protein
LDPGSGELLNVLGRGQSTSKTAVVGSHANRQAAQSGAEHWVA